MSESPNLLSRVVGRVTPGVIDAVDVGAVIDRVDVDALVQRVDVDAVVRRVDIDALMARVDVDALLARVDVQSLVGRIDLDALLAEVDLDALLARLDVDTLVGRVDIAALAERAEVGRLVTESSQQVAASTLDLFRRQVVGVDTVLRRLAGRLLGRPADDLGPLATPADAPSAAHPRRGARRASVTGRPAGPLSRLAAATLDATAIVTTFTLAVGLGAFLVEVLTPWQVDPGADGGPWWSLGLLGWAVSYVALGLVIVARTPGKAVLGLRVVGRGGAPLTVGCVVRRIVAFPLSLVSFGVAFVGILVGREGRALHDVLAGTAVVYDWGDRPAELPTPLSRWMERQGVATVAPPA